MGRVDVKGWAWSAILISIVSHGSALILSENKLAILFRFTAKLSVDRKILNFLFILDYFEKTQQAVNLWINLSSALGISALHITFDRSSFNIVFRFIGKYQ